jgi:hypothetical protein
MKNYCSNGTCHFLQGFGHRFLVEVKVLEEERKMRSEGIDCVSAIQREFLLNLFL